MKERIEITTNRLEIGPADFADLPELESLEKECDDYFSFDPPSENNHSRTIRESLIKGDLPPGGTKENYHFFKVCRNGSFIGFLAFYLGYPSAKAAYISVLYVGEKYRKSGFGAEIVQGLKEYFQSVGMEEFRLHVSLRNVTGLHFWVTNGFDHIIKVRCDGNLLPGTFAGIELRCGR